MIPKTVRVANPAVPDAFMTINQADYSERRHGPIWPEQAPGFEGLEPPPPASYTQAERLFAGELMLEMLEAHRQAEGDPALATLSPDERMTALRDHRVEFERKRERRAQHLREFDKMKNSPPTGEQRQAATVQAQGGGGGGAATEAQVGQGGQQQPAPAQASAKATEPAKQAEPAATGGAKPAWATGAKAPDPAAHTVAKGVGNKWFVMQAGKPVSNGYATKHEAEGERVRLAAPKE